MKRKRDLKEPTAGETGAPAATRTKAKTISATTPMSTLKKKTATSSTSAIEDTTSSRRAKDTKPRGNSNGTQATGKPSKSAALDAARLAAPAATAIDDAAIVLGDAPATIQIVAGSYDRTLHGVTATILQNSNSGSNVAVQFADTFLFNAHASAVRCLALSSASVPVPGQGQKIMLATGSTDERVNIYHLSAHPPTSANMPTSKEEQALMASVTRRPVMPIAENAKNRELGTLLHHSSSITKLVFPTRSKLLSASEDSTIAVTRTRDWSLLSMIKAPVPKEGMGGALRRPSGDTAPPGGAPSGVNDFAVHPSMKVMISVSRGERCMRLWNLVTGKKAGVLNFGKDLLRDLGEGRYATGEGRKVVWGRTFGEDIQDSTDEYAIGFDRNVVVFGMDSVARCKVLNNAHTKTHDFQYVEVDADSDNGTIVFSLLAVATEDGRILLCSTRADDLVSAPVEPQKDDKKPTKHPLPCARLIGQVGGKAVGVMGRVKSFKVLPVLEAVASVPEGSSKKTQKLQTVWYIVAASSTGVLRVWKLTGQELREAWKNSSSTIASADAATGNDTAPINQLGNLLGTYQTQDRITCVEAFVMIPRPEGLEDSDDELDGGDEDGEDEDGEEEDGE